MNITTRLTEELVSLVKSYSADADEAAAPEGGSSFAEWSMISLHGLRIFLEISYVMTIDLLETMTQILDVIGLDSDDLPHPSTLNKWLDRIEMAVWRVLLRRGAGASCPQSSRSRRSATGFGRNWKRS